MLLFCPLKYPLETIRMIDMFGSKKEETRMEKYKVILESQLGPREGLLHITDQDGKQTGILTLLGYENPVTGQRTGRDSFRLFHHVCTQVSRLSCTSVFKLEENKINGVLKNDWYVMKWHGEKIMSKKGEELKDGTE